MTINFEYIVRKNQFKDYSGILDMAVIVLQVDSTEFCVESIPDGLQYIISYIPIHDMYDHYTKEEFTKKYPEYII
jgi:hypothetical protein